MLQRFAERREGIWEQSNSQLNPSFNPRGGGVLSDALPLAELKRHATPAFFPYFDKTMKYRTFAAMIATSSVVMLGLMYLNTYSLDHIFWSETRFYMAILMGATMATVMLAFMFGMYKNKKANIGIFVGSAIVFATSLFLVRSQQTVDDVSWMKTMIPHHSIAILTSERANISDPRVRKLADEIIEAQRKEIAEMKQLIAELEG
ncbi:hypothetical protein RISK_005407 [Rhodopirellula islandica]|uniref:DUF305 domain-containing protein n=1 Tax=Rhodopirellula islandica TaxID=595434 RepID=A0A0J1B785_RHOIS|nr:DUF305 domain-containing protein [Rhodopirellula islandica]KLU02341.1 hypothetical protein RISK_005407 [Rhodopirellula islandica]